MAFNSTSCPGSVGIWLGRALRSRGRGPSLAAPTLAALLGAVLVACGASPIIPEGMTDACGGGNQLQLTSDLRPVQPVDFVGIRVESTEPRTRTPSSGFPSSDPAAPPSSGPTSEAAFSASFTEDVRGVPCSGAKDPATCRAKIGALRVLGTTCQGLTIVPKAAPQQSTQPEEPGRCDVRYLVYTRGDEVGLVVTPVDARAFFGDIDTPQEAIYVAAAGGERFFCGTAAYAQVSDGFEVQANGAGTSRRIVRVSQKGVVTYVRTDD